MALTLNGSGSVGGLAAGLNGVGKVLQVVTASDSSERSTTSTSYVDCGTLSVTITPTSASSTIIIMTSIPARVEATGQPAGYFQITNGSNLGIAGAAEIPIGFASGFTTSGTARFDTGVVLIGRDSPATTSPITYKVRFAATSGTLILARMSGRTSSIHAVEVAP